MGTCPPGPPPFGSGTAVLHVSRQYCFALKKSSAEYIQLHFRLDFIVEANTMNFDQAASLGQPDLGPYCLQGYLVTYTDER